MTARVVAAPIEAAPLPPPACGPASAREPGPDAPENAHTRERWLRFCLASFPEARLTVHGCCMTPALNDGERVTLVDAARRPPRIGDVVLSSQSGRLRLHRLVLGPPLARRRWRTRADCGFLLDPAVSPEDVLATVCAVEERPGARVRRPARALASLAGAVLARLRRPRCPKEKRP